MGFNVLRLVVVLIGTIINYPCVDIQCKFVHYSPWQFCCSWVTLSPFSRGQPRQGKECQTVQVKVSELPSGWYRGTDPVAQEQPDYLAGSTTKCDCVSLPLRQHLVRFKCCACLG